MVVSLDNYVSSLDRILIQISESGWHQLALAVVANTCNLKFSVVLQEICCCLRLWSNAITTR